MQENTIIKLLDKYPDKPWNWGRLSYNPNITINIIDRYPDKPWYWGGSVFGNGLSKNPNITTSILDKFSDKPWEWSYYGLSSNEFNYEKRIKFEKQNKAARIIQKGCENWLYKPILKDGKNGIVPRLAMRSNLFI